MRLIAHRGLVDGPDSLLENHPDTISKALALGYDCEIDLWCISGCLYLGHDGPQYQVDDRYLDDTRFWIHAKNLDALYWLCSKEHLNYFWHDVDRYIITSKRYIWTVNAEHTTDRTIVVWLQEPTEKTLQIPCYGICSDYSNLLTRLKV